MSVVDLLARFTSRLRTTNDARHDAHGAFATLFDDSADGRFCLEMFSPREYTRLFGQIQQVLRACADLGTPSAPLCERRHMRRPRHRPGQCAARTDRAARTRAAAQLACAFSVAKLRRCRDAHHRGRRAQVPHLSARPAAARCPSARCARALVDRRARACAALRQRAERESPAANARHSGSRRRGSGRRRRRGVGRQHAELAARRVRCGARAAR